MKHHIKNQINQAMILGAGNGKRLMPLTKECPKPLMEVAGEPLIDKILTYLRSAGVEKCVVNTHYLAEKMQSHLSTQNGLDITISHEQELLDSGGGILNAISQFNDMPFLGVNGDCWWLDGPYIPTLEKMMAAWDEEKMDALLLLVDKRKALGYFGKGDFYISDCGQLSLRSKTSQQRAPYVFCGIQVLHPKVFEGREVEPFSIVDVYQKLQDSGRLYGLVHDGAWGDIGTPEGLNAVRQAAQHFSASR